MDRRQKRKMEQREQRKQRKAAEDALRNTQTRATEDALNKSLREMEALMQNASVGILITRARKMTRYNPMFGQMFGFAGDAGIGRPAGQLFRSEQEYAALGALAAPLLSQAKPFQAELYMRRQDGTDLWINLIGYVADTHDTGRATFWILEDRSAFKSAEAALFKAQSDLAQAEKLAALGSLVVGVAHELNTPIGNALTAASTLQERSDEILAALAQGQLRRSQLDNFFAQIAPLAQLLRQSCERAAELVTAFKQVAVQQRAEQRTTFSLKTVLEQALALQQPRIAELAQQLRVQIDCEIDADIVCDSYPEALAEIITCVLENALTHAFTGRRHGRIQISVNEGSSNEGSSNEGSSNEGEWIEMRFADDGIGMDARMLTRIFDPYFTTHLGQGRSGLGLAIAHNLASAIMQGELSAESTPGQGSCFLLRFPRIKLR